MKPKERNRILQLYFFYRGVNDGSGGVITAQHVHLQQKYVTPIAKALRELDKNQYSLDHYMWLAWQGLLGDNLPNELQPSQAQLSEWANLSNKVLENNNIPCQ
ncbi:hypothetical protein [Aquimarina sediminis]|uniref:hypothetical protein n=1 Tax=Aquimarina sediminis TaxID=2070536 RepID=UPI000CA044E4|nr:hypothetical protein [Aquimarina sediminis]